MQNNEMPRGQLSNIVLYALQESDKYGFEIIESIKQLSNNNLQIKQPSLYSCLRRMEQQNLISSYWRESNIGGKRHYYSITDYGKKYAEKWKVDFSVYGNVSTTDSKEENKQDTSLAHTKNKETNKLSDENCEKKEKEEQTQNNNSIAATKFEDDKVAERLNKLDQKNKKNVAFQYDLFNNNESIVEPSSGMFDINALRKSAEITQESNDKVETTKNENVNSQNQDININNKDVKISLTAEQTYSSANINVETSYTSKRFIANKPNSLKDEISKLHSANKSFADAFKTSSLNTAPAIEEHKVELSVNQINAFSNLEENRKLKKENTNTTNFENKKQQSFISQNNLDSNVQTKKPSSRSIFDALTLQNESREINQTKNETETPVVEDERKIEDNKIDFNSILNDDNLKAYESFEEQKKVETEEQSKPHDDAKLIYDVPKPESMPKVTKIMPARFKFFDDKLITPVIPKQEELPVYEELETVKEKIYDPKLTATDLAQYYEETNIKFATYKKTNVGANKKYIVLSNKLNVASSFIVLLLSCLFSLACALIFKNKVAHLNIFGVIIPIIIMLFALYNLYLYVIDKKRYCNKDCYFSKSYLFKIAVFVLGCAVIVLINSLFGLSISNFIEYRFTCLLPILCLALIPLTNIINICLIKTKLFLFK